MRAGHNDVVGSRRTGLRPLRVLRFLRGPARWGRTELCQDTDLARRTLGRWIARPVEEPVAWQAAVQMPGQE